MNIVQSKIVSVGVTQKMPLEPKKFFNFNSLRVKMDQNLRKAEMVPE